MSFGPFLWGQLTYHVDQDIEVTTFPFLQKLCRIVFGSLTLPIITEVPFEGLFSPGTLERIGDGREGTDAFVFARILQVQGQCTMSTHTVTTDANATGVYLTKSLEDSGG